MEKLVQFCYLVGCLFIWVSICFCDTTNDPQGELVSVVVIYRHGDRTPVEPYPNDPYKNRSYWPVGFGQLTNVGKEQHFRLGQWLRQRYDSFLPLDYSETDIYVRSTDVDRTLMSAEANLAGLYPPAGNQIWDADLKWQPIPIHTTPQQEDGIIGNMDCPKYDKLQEDLLNTPKFAEINKENKELYEYISNNTGSVVDSLLDLDFIYNTLFIEQLYNFTLPKWTETIYPDKIQKWACLSFAVMCYTKDLARLKTGPFFYQLEQHFSGHAEGVPLQKFWVFSAHDSTIANILNSMDAFDVHCPPYTSTILFELRNFNGTYFVNTFYKNTTEPQKVSVNGCNFNCPLQQFKNLLSPIVVSPKKWYVECHSFFSLYGQYVILAIVLISVFFIILITLGIYYLLGRTKRGIDYLLVPDHEVSS